jgi:WD40 repeat-containing protein SMU1
MGSSKERRRQDIAEMLSTEVCVVPPSRLLTLLGHALRYQQAHGLLPKDGSLDLFRGGRRTAKKDQEESLPKREAGRIRFSAESHPETTAFSPDGLSLLTGSVDGFLELWDTETCRIRKDLDYQARDELMMHENDPILCTAFNRDGELCASGSRDGTVKVWRVATGVCLKKLSKAHSQGVTCLCFSRDSTQVLTGSFDSLVRIHGLKSGKTLKEFRCCRNSSQC